jgi:hypothetical protein
MRLSGKPAIRQFMGRGWASIEDLILHHGFPAKKIMGIWESDSDLITAWRQERLNGRQKLIKRRGNPNFRKNQPKIANNIHN